ncbi:MAG: hypothetical protein K9M03_04870 [Kiritimatiellales bacterium]|nr:hypothetical protein [Kiritimatiellales bacterium]
MLQRLRESLILLLIALLPLHAFLVTVGTKMLEGPGHAPLTILALWKEGLLAIILCIAFIEWARNQERWFDFDLIDLFIVALVVLSIVVTFFTHGDLKLFIFGFKYDFIPLLAFFALRRVDWSDTFARYALRVLVFVGVTIATYGIVTIRLPQSFFVWLGYSDLHSLYLPDAPIAAFQQIGDIGIRRIQSTMSGPNQLGLWLLLPWSVLCVRYLRGNVTSYALRVTVSFLIIVGIAIVLTFSRSAWIAAAVVTVIAYRSLRPAEEYRRFILQLTTFILEVLTLIILFVPSILVRVTSSLDHITRPLEAIQIIRENPIGLGLGTAGPASNRVSDACVYLDVGSDFTWASDRPDLCVFVGTTQVQPLDHRCKCPLLPENWYLQIGVELGILGFVLFVTLIVLVLRSLRREHETFLILLGISIAAIFLHAWEDSAVALTVWILVAHRLIVKH